LHKPNPRRVYPRPKEGDQQVGKAFSSAEQQVILRAALAINDTSESLPESGLSRGAMALRL
jgi:hypothetical protein